MSMPEIKRCHATGKFRSKQCRDVLGKETSPKSVVHGFPNKCTPLILEFCCK